MAAVKTSKYISPTIPALEKFMKSLKERCQTIISKTDPRYFDKINKEFMKYPIGNSTPQLIEACIPLLNKDFNNLAGLLGSLYEVKRGWRRLLEIYSIIEFESPIPNEWMSEARWCRFCDDSLWFADYGYLEKLISFLRKFQRNLNKTNNICNTDLINESIIEIKELREITKKARDPLAHTQSIAVGQEIYRILWQLYLAVGYKMKFTIDPLEALDSFIALDRKNTAKQAYQWIKSNYIISTNIFSQLNKIPLTTLSINKGVTS